jgi:hypothetical protein
MVYLLEELLFDDEATSWSAQRNSVVAARRLPFSLVL